MNYKELFDKNPNPCWIFDLKTFKFLKVNLAAIKRYGYTEEEFLGMTLLCIRPSSDVALVKEFLESPGEPYSSNEIWRHQDKKGNLFYVRVFGQSISYHGCKARFVTIIDVDKKVQLERKNRELHATIKQQKEQLDNIFSSIREVIWSCDPGDFRINFINGACKAVFGYEPEEIVGKAGLLTRNVHPEDLEKVKKETQKIFKNGKAVFEFRTYSKDGVLKHIYHDCVLQRDETGKMTAIHGISVDLTEKYLASQKLEEFSIKNKELLESITDAFFAVDKDWRFTYVNERCKKMYNLKAEDMLGKSLWDIFPLANTLLFRSKFHEAMKKRITVKFEEFSPSANAWVLVKLYPTREGLSVFFNDITEQKNLQEKIQDEERYKLSIINNTDDIILITDKKLKILTFNNAFSRAVFLWQGARPEAGKHISSYSKSEESSRFWENLFKKALSGISFKEIIEVKYSGKTRFFDMRFLPVMDKNQAIIGATCSGRDITESRQTLLKLQEQNEKLKKIAWIQSHKVRGPLASILGLISLFNKESFSDSLNLRLIDMLQAAALELDTVVHEVVENAEMNEAIQAKSI